MECTESLQNLWNVAMAALKATQGSAPSEDDEAMREAGSDDLIGWVDDLEDRVGLDVADFREAIVAFCAARDAEMAS